MNSLKQSFKKHPLIHTLLTAKGNPKVLLLMEPLWGIPFHLIAPFTALYMQALGISDIQIGILLSVGTVIQVIFSSFGGILTDKLGRKPTTMLGDFFGWVVPCLVWAFSGNFWMFLIAIAFNGFEQVNQTAWVCLLNEDAEREHIVNIWNWVLIAGQISLFFAPISGLFIKKTSVVVVLRVLYFSFAVFMFIKNILTQKFVTETKQGIIRKKESKHQSVKQMLAEYKDVFPLILKNKSTLLTLFIMIGLHCASMISNNFFSLYVTSNLSISESLLSIFPIFRAVVMLVFFFAAPKILDRLPFNIPMSVGLGGYIICQLLLIFCPPGNLIFLFLYALIDAVAFALVIPRKEAMMVYNIDEKERARILSLLLTITLILSTPFGYIIGLLSSMNRQYPFYLSTAFFVVMFVLVAFSKNPDN